MSINITFKKNDGGLVNCNSVMYLSKLKLNEVELQCL